MQQHTKEKEEKERKKEENWNSKKILSNTKPSYYLEIK